MGKILLYIVLYAILPPILLVSVRALKEYIKRQLFGARRSKTAIVQDVREGFNEKLNKRVKFTIKDPRNEPVPYRLVFLIILIAGLIVAVVASIIGKIGILFTAFLIHYISYGFSYITADKIVKERDEVLKRMIELKASKMRLANKEKGAIPRPENEFKILEWADDLVNPKKMYIFMPTEFDILAVDSFLESWNLIFGGQGQWIADRDDEQYGGFNFNSGVAALKVSPPLPQRADWHTRYLNPEHIHWSFFPLAIGSENGVPIYNEEIDAVEHVLGFAVNSGQNKLSKKNGVTLGTEITSAPQVLIAGGTGGGKSLNSQTPIEVVIK